MPVSNWLIYGNTITNKLDKKKQIYNDYRFKYTSLKFVLDAFEFNKVGFVIHLTNNSEILVNALVPKEYYINYNSLSKQEKDALYFNKETDISYINIEGEEGAPSIIGSTRQEIDYLNDVFDRLLDNRSWSKIDEKNEPVVLGWLLSDIYYSPSLLENLNVLISKDFDIDLNDLKKQIRKGKNYLNNNNLTNESFFDFGYLNRFIIKIGLGLRRLKYDRFTGHSRLFDVEDPLVEINPSYAAFRVIRSISNRINSIDKNPEKMELLEKLKSKNPEMDLILNKDNDTLKQYLNLNFTEENILKLESRIIEIQGF